MKPPAELKPWLDTDGLLTWVRDAQSRNEYQRRLAVWLTHIGPFPARQVATLLGVSIPSIWKWVGEYNRSGPPALERQGRGGRHWAYLTLEQEAALLRRHEARALRGEVLTAKHLHAEVERTAGRPVSMAYVYKLLRRQNWRKLSPRPRHIKSDPAAQADFKKNSRSRSRRR